MKKMVKAIVMVMTDDTSKKPDVYVCVARKCSLTNSIPDGFTSFFNPTSANVRTQLMSPFSV